MKVVVMKVIVVMVMLVMSRHRQRHSGAGEECDEVAGKHEYHSSNPHASIYVNHPIPSDVLLDRNHES